MKRALLGLTLLALAAFSTVAAVPPDIPASAKVSATRTRYPMRVVTPAPMMTLWPLPPTATPTPTPRPTRTPRPARTARPTRTPKPARTPRPAVTAAAETVAPAAEPGALDLKLAMLLDGGMVVEVYDGNLLDLDGDGALDEIHFTWDTDRYGTGTYTLSTNLSSFSGGCEALVYALYAGRLAGPSGPVYLMVADNGPSDDPVCHIYQYAEGALRSVGSVPALPETFLIGGAGFSTGIRGRVLHTWFRPAEYRIDPPVAEVPRELYPMNSVVTLRIDLNLLEERGGAAVSATLAGGEEAVLATTDDVEWVYVIRSGDKTVGGWLHLIDGLCQVGGALMDPQEVFDGLVIAD